MDGVRVDLGYEEQQNRSGFGMDPGANMMQNEGYNTRNQDRSREMQLYLEEEFQIFGSDNLGMMIVNTPLTTSTYLLWKIAMMTALNAKAKLGFVDGTCVKLPVDYVAYLR